MRFRKPAFLFAFLLAAGAGLAPLAAGHGVHCPRCRQLCDVTVEKSTETKYCWKVECQPICIPRVTFPWEVCKTNCDDCPQPARCARVKHVNVLVKHEYECPACKYTFTPCPTGCDCSEPNSEQPVETAVAPLAPAVNVEPGAATPAMLPPRPKQATGPGNKTAQRGYLEILTGFFD